MEKITVLVSSKVLVFPHACKKKSYSQGIKSYFTVESRKFVVLISNYQ